MTTITEDQYLQAQELLIASIKENLPDIDTGVGTPTREILVNVGGLISAVIQSQIDTFEATSSFKNLEANPSLAQTDVLDGLLSNWFATRNTGDKATGQLQVIYASNITQYIPADTQFTTAGGLVFTNSDPYVIEPADTAAPGSVKLYPYTTDTYRALIPVTAEVEGTSYQLKAGTSLTAPSLGTLVVNISAFTDFDGGAAAEGVTDSISRTRESLALRMLSSYKAIRAVLLEQFTTIQKLVIVGYGFREMQRDRATPLGVGRGSKVDIYVKTPLENTVLTKTVSDTGVIELTSVDEIPIYRIRSISKQQFPGLPLETTAYSVDYSADTEQTANYLSNVTQGRFTVYEEVTITITDESYFGETVLLSVDRPTWVDEIQQYVLSTDTRAVCADQLVRGAIPCYVTVSMIIEFTYEEPIDTIKTAIQEYILGAAAINASEIVDIVHNQDAVSKVQLPISITGLLILPDGTTQTLESSDSLVIPTDYSLSLSSNTVTYFNEYIYINEES